MPVYPSGCPFVQNWYRSSEYGVGTGQGREFSVSSSAREERIGNGRNGAGLQWEFSVRRSVREEELGRAQLARWINRCATSSFQSARSSILAARGFWLLYY